MPQKPSNVAPNSAGEVQKPKLGKTGGGPAGGGGGAGLAPKPRANAKLAPTVTPSVNYDHHQNSAPTAPIHLGASGRDYADQQQQPVPDKGT